MSLMSISTSSKGQTALEAAFLFTFMIMTLVLFLLVIGSKYAEIQEQKVRQILDNVGLQIETEIKVGASAQDGFYRQFELPNKAAGRAYYIKFRNASLLGTPTTLANFSEVAIGFLNSSFVYETSVFLPPNIKGNISVGWNDMKKTGGVLTLSNITRN